MSTLSDLLSSFTHSGTAISPQLPGASSAVAPTIVNPAASSPFVPDASISQQYKLADQLRDVPQAHSWWGVGANALGALGGNLVQGDANNATANNQATTSKAIQSAVSAPDLQTEIKGMASSGVPALQSQALTSQLSAAGSANQIRVRAAQLIQAKVDPRSPIGQRYLLTGEMSDPADASLKSAQARQASSQADISAALAPEIKARLAARTSQPSAPPTQNLAQPQSLDEYNAIPSGQTYALPDGSTRIKP